MIETPWEIDAISLHFDFILNSEIYQSVPAALVIKLKLNKTFNLKFTGLTLPFCAILCMNILSANKTQSTLNKIPMHSLTKTLIFHFLNQKSSISAPSSMASTVFRWKCETQLFYSIQIEMGNDASQWNERNINRTFGRILEIL